MRAHGYLVGVVVALALAFLGCARTDPPTEPAGPQGVTIEEYSGGAHSTTELPRLGDLKVSDAPYYIEIRSRELWVNGKNYGPLRPGHRVSVKGWGDVWVNDERRSPAEK